MSDAEPVPVKISDQFIILVTKKMFNILNKEKNDNGQDLAELMVLKGEIKGQKDEGDYRKWVGRGVFYTIA
jgi:hypothetical protein